MSRLDPITVLQLMSVKSSLKKSEAVYSLDYKVTTYPAGQSKLQ